MGLVWRRKGTKKVAYLCRSAYRLLQDAILHEPTLLAYELTSVAQKKALRYPERLAAVGLGPVAVHSGHITRVQRTYQRSWICLQRGHTERARVGPARATADRGDSLPPSYRFQGLLATTMMATTLAAICARLAKNCVGLKGSPSGFTGTVITLPGPGLRSEVKNRNRLFTRAEPLA
ncbi:MAG: hypothetical protein KatS3mg081_0051 [Gemmatimonadales bacterium]|nr:MAG: hypothetical protein KatS3mg081_0051 [Gemmatimonadales bacterium]